MRQVETGLKITGDSKGGVRAVRATRTELDKFNKTKKRGSKRAKEYAKSTRGMTSATRLFAGAVAAVGLTNLGRQMVDVIVETEKLKGSLVTMTGSAEAAEGAFAALTRFAKQTPFTLDQSVTAFVRMKSLGLVPTESALKSFGNTSAAMGKDLTQMIEAVADATTGEFERLKEFGIKAKQNGDEVSLTFQGVTTTIGNNAQEITGYLESIGNVQFAGAMEEQMNRLPGALSNLRDSLEGFTRDIFGTGFTDALVAGIQRLSAFISSNSKKWAANLRFAFDVAAAHAKAFLSVVQPGFEMMISLFKDLAGGTVGDALRAVKFFGKAMSELPANFEASVGIMIGEGAKLAAELDYFFDIASENINFSFRAAWLKVQEIIAGAIDWMLENLSGLLEKLAGAAQKLGFDGVANSISQASAQLKNLANSEKKIAAEIAAANKAHKENIKIISARRKATMAVANDYIAGVLKQRDARLKQMETDLEAAKTQRDLNASVQESTESLDKYAGKAAEAADQVGDNSKEMADAWQEATKRIDSAFADAWAGAFDSFSDFADQIKNAFKKLLGELIHQATTKKILIHLGLGTGAAGGDILGGLLGSGTAAGGGGGGLLGALGATKLGSLGLVIAGGLIGNKAGNALGGALFGKEANSRIGAGIGGTIGAVVGGPVGAAIGSFLGGLVDSLFGSSNKKRFQVGVATDPRASRKNQVARVTAPSGLALSAQNERGKEEGEEAARALLNSFLAIDTILVTSLESLGSEIDLAGNIIGRRKGGVNKLEGFFGSAKFNGIDSAALEKAPTEFVVAWLNAVQGALTDEIKRILPLVRRDAEELVGTVASIANIQEILATNVFDAIDGASRTLFEAYQSQIASAIELAGAYDGSLESLAAFEEAVVLQRDISLNLAAQIKEAFGAVENLFGDTRRSITESLLTEEELYNSRRREVASLVDDLRTEVDPARIAQLSQDINALTSDAFSLLDEGQQEALAGGFVNFLNEAENIANNRLEATRADVSTGNDQINTAFDTTIAKLEEAAELQREAAEEQLRLIREMFEAFGGGLGFGGGFGFGAGFAPGYNNGNFAFSEVNA